MPVLRMSRMRSFNEHSLKKVLSMAGMRGWGNMMYLMLSQHGGNPHMEKKLLSVSEDDIPNNNVCINA